MDLGRGAKFDQKTTGSHRRAKIFVNNVLAGIFEELKRGKHYRFTYLEEYSGDPISLTMDKKLKSYEFDHFPPVFDGLLPEGVMLQALLKKAKIDRDDLFSQLVTVGSDLVGWITVKEER